MADTVTNPTGQALEVQYSTTWAARYGLTPLQWAQFLGDDGQNGGDGGSLTVQPGETVGLPASLPKSALPAVFQ